MKFKSVVFVLLCMVIVLTGCNTQNVDPTKESQGSNTEATENTSEAATENIYSRSESTIKNDPKTGSIITSQNSYQLNTVITLSIYADKEVPNEVFTELFEEIAYYENMISKTIEGSELSQINENAGIKPVTISDEMMEIVTKGINYAENSGGLFDVSIGPVVNLWGIGTDLAAVPTDADLKSSMSVVDYKKIILDTNENTIFLEDKGMALDLGGIAKGYIADRVKALIIENGYESAIINLGGNVLTVGVKPNGANWVIGVRDPEIDAVTELGAISVTGRSVVSSGIYERFFSEGDKRYHHIINPYTGYPEDNDLMSVSIISELSVDGDALSTTVFLLGLEKGYEYIESLEDVEAIFIMKDRSIYVTSGMQENFVLFNESYTVKDINE